MYGTLLSNPVGAGFGVGAMAAENLFLPADHCWGKNSLQGQCQNFPAKLEIFCPIPPLLMQNSSDLAHFEMKNHVFCIFFSNKNIIYKIISQNEKENNRVEMSKEVFILKNNGSFLETMKPPILNKN